MGLFSMPGRPFRTTGLRLPIRLHSERQFQPPDPTRVLVRVGTRLLSLTAAARRDARVVGALLALCLTGLGAAILGSLR